jgi:hypothetical protein
VGSVDSSFWVWVQSRVNHGTIKTYRGYAEEIFQNLKVLSARIGLSELDG